MTLNQLRYFCAASRCHSISRAAKELFVTQPTISIAVRDLEEEFSITLFYRNGGKLELTSEGEKFLIKAESILRYCIDMEAEYKDLKRIKPPVRIGIPPMLSTIFFPELINAFNKKYQDIPVILEEFGSARACDLVQQDRLDLALVNMELFNIDKFNNFVLFCSQLYYCVDQNHPMAGLSVMEMDKFEGEKILLFNADSVQNQLLMTRFDAMQIHPDILMKCSQLYTIMQFVRQGNCGCFLFKEMLPLFPECIGLPLDPPIHVRVGIIWKKGKYITGEMQKFISFIENYYQRTAADKPDDQCV